jgi:hypothetical protein
VDDGEDVADPAVPGRIITLFQQAVKVVREQNWEELALVQSIDWLRPPQPRDYIPPSHENAADILDALFVTRSWPDPPFCRSTFLQPPVNVRAL